jgi:hypothetical protein
LALALCGVAGREPVRTRWWAFPDGNCIILLDSIISLLGYFLFGEGVGALI